MKKGKVYLICFLVLFVLLGCSNPFWTLKDEPKITEELKGTISISPAVPEKGTPVTITYTPGPGESAFPGGYQIEWFKESPPGSGKFVSVSKENPFTPTDPGTYKVNITDPVTGKVKEQVLIINDPDDQNLTGNLGISGTGITGQPLTGTYSGSEGPVTYQWYRQSPPPVSLVSSSSTFTPTIPGTYVVVATVEGFNQKVSAPIVVTAPSTQIGILTGTINTSPTQPVKGTPVDITYVPGSDEPAFPGNYQITWSKEEPTGSGNFTLVSSDNPFNPTDPGTYKVRVRDPATGKVKEQILIVNDPLLPNLAGNVGINGSGLTGEPLIATYSGSDGTPVYQWYREVPPPITSVSSSNPFTPTEPGTYVVVATVDGRNPKVSATVVVTDPSAPTGTLTGTINSSPTPPEAGDPVTLTYTPGPGEAVDPSKLTYEWSKEEDPAGSGNFVSVSKANPFTPTDPGTYKVKVTDPATGKVKEQVIIVNDPPLPDLTGNVGITGTGKTGEPLIATYSGSDGTPVYQWYREVPPPITSVSSSNPFTPTEPGTYVVVATVDGRNPKVSDPIIVTNTGGLTGTFGDVTPNPPLIDSPVNIPFTPGAGEPAFPGGYQIRVYRDDPPPVTQVATSLPFTPAGAGTYRIRVTDLATGRIKEQIITIYLPQYTVSFVNFSSLPALEGSAFNPQTISRNGRVTDPGSPASSFGPPCPIEDPGATPSAGIWREARVILDGWFNGSTRWNFATSAVTGDTTLEARWRTPGLVTNNMSSYTYGYLHEACRDAPGNYLVLMDRDLGWMVTSASTYGSNIIFRTRPGSGGPHSFWANYPSGSPFFQIDGSLTLDNAGVSFSDGFGPHSVTLVSLTSTATMTMLPGSFVRNATTSGVNVAGYSTLRMRGGVINGNNQGINLGANGTLDLNYDGPVYTAIYGNTTNIAGTGTNLIPGTATTGARIQGATVAVPSEASKTTTSITLNTVARPTGQFAGYQQEVEYGFMPANLADGNPTWQDSPVFTGLAAGQMYRFWTRTKANNVYATGSMSSPATTISTNLF